MLSLYPTIGFQSKVRARQGRRGGSWCSVVSRCHSPLRKINSWQIDAQPSFVIELSAPVEIELERGVLLVGIGVDLEGRRLAPLIPEYA